MAEHIEIRDSLGAAVICLLAATYRNADIGFLERLIFGLQAHLPATDSGKAADLLKLALEHMRDVPCH